MSHETQLLYWGDSPCSIPGSYKGLGWANTSSPQPQCENPGVWLPQAPAPQHYPSWNTLQVEGLSTEGIGRVPGLS